MKKIRPENRDREMRLYNLFKYKKIAKKYKNLMKKMRKANKKSIKKKEKIKNKN